MANGTGSGGSVQTTAAVALPVGAGLIVATYLTHPVWPPPQEVLTVVVTAAAPLLHLIYKGFYRWLTGVVGENGADVPAEPPVVAPSIISVVGPLAPPSAATVIVQPPPVPPVPPAPQPAPGGQPQ